MNQSEMLSILCQKELPGFLSEASRGVNLVASSFFLIFIRSLEQVCGISPQAKQDHRDRQDHQDRQDHRDHQDR